MRIVGGTYRGRKLAVPKGFDVRPTSDKVKQALFNIIGGAAIGATVLDPFAGCGALGIEAISRGAEKAVLLDKDPRSLAVIRKNVESVGAGDQCIVMRLDALKPGDRLSEYAPFDLVFLDPPYRKYLAVQTMKMLREKSLVKTGALCIVESERDEIIDPGSGWFPEKKKDYGRTTLHFFQFEN